MNTTPSRAAVTDQEISRVAVKLFLAITSEWGLTDEQSCVIAGLSACTTLQNWRHKLEADKPVRLSSDTLERISYLAGIYKNIQLLFTDQAQWKNWVHKPNRDFDGVSALDRMLMGRVMDLVDVRRYLDAYSM